MQFYAKYDENEQRSAPDASAYERPVNDHNINSLNSSKRVTLHTNDVIYNHIKTDAGYSPTLPLVQYKRERRTSRDLF